MNQKFVLVVEFSSILRSCLKQIDLGYFFFKVLVFRKNLYTNYKVYSQFKEYK